jgi:hypothetical protein
MHISLINNPGSFKKEALRPREEKELLKVPQLN